jgi:hypothetical protein
MIPKKPAPDLIRGGNRFSEEIMPNKMLVWFGSEIPLDGLAVRMRGISEPPH